MLQFSHIIRQLLEQVAFKLLKFYADSSPNRLSDVVTDWTSCFFPKTRHKCMNWLRMRSWCSSMELEKECCVLEPLPVSGMWKQLHDAMGVSGRILTDTQEISTIQRNYIWISRSSFCVLLFHCCFPEHCSGWKEELHLSPCRALFSLLPMEKDSKLWLIATLAFRTEEEDLHHFVMFLISMN